MTNAGMTDDANSTGENADAENGSRPAGGGNHTLYMIAAIVLAFVVAWLAPEFAWSLETGGEVFLRLLTMVVVPLVMASVMSGILGLGDVRKLGKPGAAAVGYYLMTTVLAVTIGVIVVNVFQPGVGVNAKAALEAAGSISEVSEVAASDKHPQGIADLGESWMLATARKIQWPCETDRARNCGNCKDEQRVRDGTTSAPGSTAAMVPLNLDH